MLIFVAFLSLLSPFSTLQVSVGERKNSTKTAPHSITTLNIKQKPPTISPAPKISNVGQILFSTTLPPATSSIKKSSKDKPSSSMPIKVVIADGCIQKEAQKDTVNSSKGQDTELSLKPGSPLIMTHHISLVPGSCTGGCETEMAALKDRVEILEKEMSALKKKCTLCSGVPCPNNCNKNGKCVNGKCVCKAGFTGTDCSKGAIKGSSDVKPVASSQVQLKVNETIINTKDKEEKQKHQDQPRGPATIEKISLSKDLPLNHNVTPSTEKKSTGLLKVLITLSKDTEQLTNVHVQTNSDKEKLALSNVTSTENEKNPPQDSVMNVLKVGTSVIQKLEKHSNASEELKGRDKIQHKGHEKNILKKHPGVTISTEKDKKPHKESVTVFKEGSSEKKMVEKHSNVTSSIENKKKPSQGNSTQPKEGSIKGKVEKLSIVTTEKDKKLHISNNLPKDRSSGKKTKDSFLNVTAAINKDKKLPEEGESNRKAILGNKKEETHVHVTTSTEKDKKLNQVNVTPLQDTSSGKTKMDKHLNATNFTEQDRKNQTKEKTSGMRNVTASSEKRKTLKPGNETKVKIIQGKKTEQKHANITVIPEKESKLHQGNDTINESHRVTMSIEKDKKLFQNNETKVFNDVTDEKKKVDKHLIVSTFIEKGKKLHKGNGTLIRKGTPPKGKVDDVSENIPSQKGKKFLQGDETTDVTQGIEEKAVNATNASDKDKSFHHSLKEDGSRKTKTSSDLKNITISKAHVSRSNKFIDIGPVKVQNITATGFVITWEAPQGLFSTFTVTRREVLPGRSDEDDAEEAEKSQEGDIKADELYSSNRTSSKGYTGKADKKSAEKLPQILAGGARSYHFKNLRPQKRYSVSLIGSGPHVRSKVHRLFVSTGPEPPTELQISNITETSLALSWTKPKSTVTGFKVTYTNSANGVTGSMSVDSQLCHVLISKLSVGSQYDISVRSVMGTVESEATTVSVVTVPDSPTELQAVNVTDSKALLVWKPAQAKVDHYILIYGSTRSPNVTVTVMLSGTSVEHQLRGLHRSTIYTVKIMSQHHSLQSSSVSTTFTTKSGVKLQVVTPSQVTWNSALISWKTTHLSFRSYRLTYQFGEEVKEVILNPTVSQYEITGLVASSHYTIKVDGESEGHYISVVSSSFTTAQLPYLYPAECSQVLLNGMKKSGEAEIYPEGKGGTAVRVYCDMETDGGGWTVFQRRADGSTDFFREWKDYSKGFGEMSAEFWLGNDIIHALTSIEPMSLRIDLRLRNDTAYAHYSNFSVGPESDHYTIEVSGYSGTAGDSLRYHNGCPFSTIDKGPSNNSTNCAKKYMGGWWYKNCYKANLNGVYATFSKDQGVVWIDWKGKDISLPFTEMKLRPASPSHMTPNSQT